MQKIFKIKDFVFAFSSWILSSICFEAASCARNRLMVLVSSGSRMFPSLSRTTRSRSRYLARFISGHKPKHTNCKHPSQHFLVRKTKLFVSSICSILPQVKEIRTGEGFGQILLSPNHSLLPQRWKSSLYLNTALKFHHRRKMALHHFHFQTFSSGPTADTAGSVIFMMKWSAVLLEPKSGCFVQRLNDDPSSSLDWQCRPIPTRALLPDRLGDKGI